MGMTREEFSAIVKGLKSVYGMDSFIRDKDAFDMWYGLLKDLEYKQLSIGATKFMQTSNKIPTPADLRMASIAESDMSEGEAWAMVLKAIGRSYYYYKEEYNKLPALIQRAVGIPENLKEWSQINDASSLSVTQSQFLNSYRKEQKRERDMELVSPKIRELLGEISDKLAIEDKDDFSQYMNPPET